MIVVETLCKNIAPSLYLSLSDCCHGDEEHVFHWILGVCVHSELPAVP